VVRSAIVLALTSLVALSIGVATSSTAAARTHAGGASDPLLWAWVGSVDERGAFILVTLGAGERSVVDAFDSARTDDGRALEDARGELDAARWLEITTPILARALGGASPFVPGKPWHAITTSGSSAGTVSGLDLVLDGHHHYLVVHIAGLRRHSSLALERPPAIAAAAIDRGLALFIRRPPAPGTTLASATARSLPPAADLGRVRDAIAEGASPDLQGRLRPLTLSAANTRIVEGQFPDDVSLVEFVFDASDDEEMLNCDNKASVLTFYDFRRANIVDYPGAMPRLTWASGANLTARGFSGCAQVLARVTTPGRPDSFIAEFPYTTGNDVVLFVWDAANERYVGRALYGQGSG